MPEREREIIIEFGIVSVSSSIWTWFKEKWRNKVAVGKAMAGLNPFLFNLF